MVEMDFAVVVVRRRLVLEDNLIPLIMTKISMILHNCNSLFSLYICFYICNCTDTMYILSINEYLLTTYWLETFPLHHIRANRSTLCWFFFFFFFYMAESNTSLLPLNTMVHLVTIKLTPTNYLLWRR